jgi:hypothetical protein
MHPLGMCKISKTNMLINQPQKKCHILRYPCVASVKQVTFKHVVCRICMMFRAMLQSALCNYSAYLWSWQRHFSRLCKCNIGLYTQYMYNSITYAYKRMYVDAPTLEAAATTVFVVWLRSWMHSVPSKRTMYCISDNTHIVTICTLVTNSSKKSQNS